MSANEQLNLNASRNIDKTFALVARNVDGSIINLTGLSLRAEVRKTAAATIFISASTTNSKMAITNAANGSFTWTITAAELQAMEKGLYYYDIVTVNGSTVKNHIYEGDFDVTQPVIDSGAASVNPPVNFPVSVGFGLPNFVFSQEIGLPSNGIDEDLTKLAAAATAMSNSGGGIIQLTSPILRFNGPWSPPPNVSIIGLGKNVSKILSYTNTPILHNGTYPLKYFRLLGMLIQNMTGTNNTNALAIKLDSTNHCEISNIQFKDYNAGQIALFNPTLDVPSDDRNFVFNEFHDWYVLRCRRYIDCAGGLNSGPVTNLGTHNIFSKHVARELTESGVDYKRWFDNDLWFDTFLNSEADNMSLVSLSSDHVSSYVGVAGHLFINLVLVKNDALPYANPLYGVRMNNAPYCDFVSLTSDFDWPTSGRFLFNPLKVQAMVASRFMQQGPGASSTSRMGLLIQGNAVRRASKQVFNIGEQTKTINHGCFRKPTYINLSIGTTGPAQEIDYTYANVASNIAGAVGIAFNELNITETQFTINLTAPAASPIAVYWEAVVDELHST